MSETIYYAASTSSRIYVEQGYTDRNDYLTCLAEDYGIDVETVFTLADMLGPSEDFDGFVASLEDVQ